MKQKIAKRLDGVSESATLRLNAAVQEMKSKGIDVVNFSTGEPDFSPPKAAMDAIIKAVEENKTKYTPAAGMKELKELVADKTNKQQPELTTKWTQSNVVISNGGKQAIFNTLLSLIDPGDEVLIPKPYWVSYPEMVKLAGGVPVFIETELETGFKITPKQLESAIIQNKRLKLMILTSPNNPTGSMYSREELKELGRVIIHHSDECDLWVLSDEIYDKIVFSNEFCSFLSACPYLKERTVTVNGLSKSCAMTGLRVGWTVASDLVTQAISTIQGQSTSGVNAMSQSAGIAALKTPEAEFNWQISKYKERRDLAVRLLRENSKLKVFNPEGAFYLFVKVGAFFLPGEESIGFAERLLKEAKVAVVPGGPFGAEEYVRLSFAMDEKDLQLGCRRILSFLK